MFHDSIVNDDLACGLVNAAKGLFYNRDREMCEQRMLGCGICLVSNLVWFHLKGVPPALKKAIDNQYFIYGLKNDRLMMRGIAKSDLYYENDGWTTYSYILKKSIWLFEDRVEKLHPFGRHNLTMYSEDYTLVLKISSNKLFETCPAQARRGSTR